MRFNIVSKLLMILLVASVTELPRASAAVSDEDLEVIDLEQLYKTQETQMQRSQAPSTPVDATESTTTPEDAIVVEAEVKQEELRVQELKDLSRLVPFSEISVIQKKFMPKTGRFQLFAGLGLATNTPWYNNYGAKLNLGYNFIESFGIELSTLFITSSPREVAKEIKDNNNVEANQFIYTKGYYGLDLVWSPVYGKITYNNEKIINYEMYFSLGGGISTTNSKEKEVSTIKIAAGQIFSITKSMAFRWDYGISAFQATSETTGTAGTAAKNSYYDQVLTAGFSFFFPEASYR